MTSLPVEPSVRELVATYTARSAEFVVSSCAPAYIIYIARTYLEELSSV